MELDAKTAALMNFAGFALAHGVGGVSSGKTLCTMALVQCQKEQGLSQYPGPIGASVAQAKAATEGLDDLQRRAIIYDGLVTVGGAESSAVPWGAGALYEVHAAGSWHDVERASRSGSGPRGSALLRRR